MGIWYINVKYRVAECVCFLLFGVRAGGNHGEKPEGVMLHVQVTVPSLQSRFHHSATAFSLSPGLTEVTIFGGCPNWPINYKSDVDLPQIANTTVLRFGESHLMFVSHTSHRSCDRDTTIASQCNYASMSLRLVEY